MSDNTQQRGPRDSSRVNVNEDYELRYWSQKFGKTPEQLKEAINTVGPMAKNVEAYLTKH